MDTESIIKESVIERDKIWRNESAFKNDLKMYVCLEENCEL